MSPTSFGVLPDGQAVTAYTIASPSGLAVRLLDLGATVQSLRVPSAEGPLEVVLGHDDVAGYLAPGGGFHGAVVGRYANRIAGSRFTLDGTVHTLAANEGPTCLHGGPAGFHRRRWTVSGHTDDTVIFELVSPDGDQGFPGELWARARYSVGDAGVLLELSAECDRPTVVSLTNHSYFNLGGVGAGTVDDHLLTVDADRYLPVDDRSIPLGYAADVAGTPFDLRVPARLGRRIRQPHPQLVQAKGFDHAYLVNGEGLRRAARLEHPASGRYLEVHTDQPSLQVYTGNALDGSAAGFGGVPLRQGDGIALETQRPPDAPNQPQLGSAVLRPGEQYQASTLWRLGTTERG
jgi:aldose 1-epimerase